MKSLKDLEGDVARFRAAWHAVPADARWRRGLCIAAVALGLVLTMARSHLYAQTGAYPLGVIPDARPVALFMVAFVLGAYAAAGPTQRRVQLLWFTVGIALLFQLEASSVHWFTDHQGTLTGTRVDVIAFTGTALALGGVLALNGDVAAAAFAADHRERGGTAVAADAARRGLAEAATTRAFGIAGAVAGLGVLVVLAESVFGDASVGTAYPALAVGAGTLAALAAFVLVNARRRRA